MYTRMYIYIYVYIYICIYWVWPPPGIPVANEGLQGFPTKHVIVLVVNGILGRGPHPRLVGSFHPFEKYSKEGSSPQVGIEIKNVSNHYQEYYIYRKYIYIYICRM